MMKTQVGQAPSMAKAILWGTGIGILWAAVCAAIIAKLLDSEVLRMESVGYGSLIAHLTAVFIGSKAAMGKAGHMPMPAAAATGVCYYLCLLLVNALFFGGYFTGMGTTLLLVVLAAGASILTAGQGRGHKRRRRYKIPK